MGQIIPRRNYLGASGWAYGGAYKGERYLYLLHRITGLGLILFVAFHLIVTTIFRFQGQGVWESAMSTLSNPATKVGEYLVAAAFAFHFFNGIRLIIQELGFGLGKPTPPIYPYKDSLRKNRTWAITFLVLALVLAVVFLVDVVVGG